VQRRSRWSRPVSMQHLCPISPMTNRRSRPHSPLLLPTWLPHFLRLTCPIFSTMPCPLAGYTGYRVTQIVACGVDAKPPPAVCACAKAPASISSGTSLPSTTGTYGVPIVSGREQEAALTAIAISAASTLSPMDAEDLWEALYLRAKGQWRAAAASRMAASRVAASRWPGPCP